MSNEDPSVRPILPQQSQMNSFSFAPQQYTQRETQKNYVFVDEHNRHKRLKVMRACEGCRRRKIKCDAATTNTWPCSACIRLKLHCVRPNGFDGANDSTTYETSPMGSEQYQQMPMQHQVMNPGAKLSPAAMYGTQPQQVYPDANASYQHVSYDTSQQPGMHYGAVAPPGSMMDHQYAGQNVFPTPPMHQPPPPPGAQQQPSPEAYSSPGDYQHHDLADLLGTLKVNETGTAPYLRNKASFRHEEQPAVEEADDFPGALPPMMPAPGHKIRIPPELMPDDETALSYFDLYFTHVHPYVPVLCKTVFYQQWNTDREAISPLILEAIFAMGGRLAEEPTEGQQWLALASRHADSFMDVPRLSTLQALLMILKAREAAPKRGYYYRSWMTVVQCVQMGKDLGLDEHHEDHQAGIACEFTPAECQLRKRIWQTIFVCEVMVGAPQGRHDHAVKLNTVDFTASRPVPGCEESEYHTSRNFSYFSQVVRTVSAMSKVYTRLRRRKDWGVDPEFQQLGQSFNTWLAELPPDLAISFPQDGSPPWIPSHFIGNMHGYFYLAQILFHRPILSFLDPNSNDGQWKRHMMICYSSSKALCRVQEATLNTFGLTGLQCMQRGFSFSLYAGLSCIVIHLVAIVSPDPEFNSDAREYFTRHMRVLEKVMESWSMPELEKQINALREAFSADVRKPFVLKPSFPYGSPHPSTHSSPPRGSEPFRPVIHRTGSIDQHLDTHGAQHSLVMMSQGTQGPGMPQSLSMADQPGWNPSRLFEQWNTTFGATEVPTIQDIQAVQATMPTGSNQLSPPQYTAAPVPNFVTPAMWQESVASVYEGGLKRGWDYDGVAVMKRH
uniref:Lipase regulator 1 n=1 Tax=Gibberella zeae TaxID=5518 RepID=F1C5P3_GIBZA|nr:lipase regulator 1 [Fusarium graminearum]ADX77910.1 lipase regulator 1 [Fusarium graminearum]